jgi:probable F420-dependent oxidoreductase
MRWSIRLPEPRATPAPTTKHVVACAQAVDAGGWDGVWVTDHPFPVIAEGKQGHHAWDPFAALAFVAGSTSRVVLHSNLCVLPYRNPFHVAKSAATVQHLSGGRLALTVGAGYNRPEFDALGADFDHREVLLREGVVAMEAAWSGAPVEAVGAGWRAEGNTMLPAARPTWLLRGGNGRVAVKHAAQSFDAWAPVEATSTLAGQMASTPLQLKDSLAEKIDLLREEAAAVGRETPEVWVTRCIDDWLQLSRDEVRSEISRLEELGVTWLAIWIGSLEEGVTTDEYRRRLDVLESRVR